MSGDPTRIDIEFDPLTQHMRGVSMHGHIPFDVPFMSQIASNLWLGGCQDGMILPSFIKHLVSLYPWEAYTVNHDLDTALEVTMYDSEEQAFDQVDTIAAWINECRATGPVLVHCQAGLNRSSLVAARALVLEGMPPAEAIALIRAKRSPACLCNPAFERWLLANEAGTRHSSGPGCCAAQPRHAGQLTGMYRRRSQFVGARQETARSARPESTRRSASPLVQARWRSMRMTG